MKQIDALKRELRFLSFSRKLVLFGCLGTIVFLLFPWGTHGVQSAGIFAFEAKNFNAFQIFPIFGWLLLIISFISLAFLLSEMRSGQTYFRSLSHALFWIILGSFGVYTLLIALFIFHSAYLKGADSNFSVKISIFLCLFFQAVLVFGGYIGRRDEGKKNLKESLSKPQNIDTSHVHLEPEVQEEQLSLGDYDRRS